MKGNGDLEVALRLHAPKGFREKQGRHPEVLGP